MQIGIMGRLLQFSLQQNLVPSSLVDMLLRQVSVMGKMKRHVFDGECMDGLFMHPTGITNGLGKQTRQPIAHRMSVTLMSVMTFHGDRADI